MACLPELLGVTIWVKPTLAWNSCKSPPPLNPGEPSIFMLLPADLLHFSPAMNAPKMDVYATVWLLVEIDPSVHAP